MNKTTAIVAFSGFTENIDENTGTMRLYEDVLAKYGNSLVQVFTPREWNENPAAFARMLKNLDFNHIIVIGYSWGGGWGSQIFAEECKKIGLSIPIMLLCDPVYRPSWMPGWAGANPLNIRSLCSNVKILIPECVQKVVWCKQRENFPRGHDLKARDWHTTWITKPLVLKHTHTNIDNSKEWFELVDKTIKEFLK